jgi:hypothetical protein
MRIAYVAFGLTFAVIGVAHLVEGGIANSAFYLALGVGWLLLAAFKSRRSASHPSLSEAAPEPDRLER